MSAFDIATLAPPDCCARASKVGERVSICVEEVYERAPRQLGVYKGRIVALSSRGRAFVKLDRFKDRVRVPLADCAVEVPA